MLTFRVWPARSLLRRGTCRPFGGSDEKVSIAAHRLALGLAGIAGAQAQTYPSRPITIIVPFAAGGPTDTVARILADQMKDTLGQTLVIENVTGAGAHHRHRPRDRRGAGRLHRHRRQLVEPRRRRRALSGALAHRPTIWSRSPGSPSSTLMIVGKHRIAGQGPQGADRLAQGQSRQGDGRQRRRRQRRAHLRALFHGEDRHQLPVRAVSRRRAGDAGRCSSATDRPDVRRGVADAGACARPAR